MTDIGERIQKEFKPIKMLTYPRKASPGFAYHLLLEGDEKLLLTISEDYPDHIVFLYEIKGEIIAASACEVEQFFEAFKELKSETPVS